MKASECKCCVCGKQAVAFWPVIDPDIPAEPYCRKCLDEAKQELMLKNLRSCCNMTYWVEYEYSYTLLSGEEIEDMDSGRFHCRKRDIEKSVVERVIKELEYERYTDLKIFINDAYPTTDCEV